MKCKYLGLDYLLCHNLFDCLDAPRNYHVFYYLLVGTTKDEQEEFHLLQPQDYLYLKQVPLICTLGGSMTETAGQGLNMMCHFMLSTWGKPAVDSL